MLSRQLVSKWQLWIVLLGTFLGTIACAIPLNPTLTQAAPSATKGDPPVFLPTLTQPVLPTPTSAPTDTALSPDPTPASPQPTGTKEPAQLSQVTIYFIAIGDEGQRGPLVGCGDSLVGLKHPIEPTSGVIRAALNKLFSYKNLRIGESGLYNALWQSDLTLDKASVQDGVATVYLTGTVMMGGECDTPRFKGQIEQTILAQPGVTRADVFLNGKPIDEALSLK